MSVTNIPTQPAPVSIWQELERWSQGLAVWQKLLLAAAVRNGVISDATLAQSYSAFLAECQLAPPLEPAPELPATITGREQAGGAPRRLHRLYSPSGVNRLPVTAELSFAEGLTVIYGGNGVGKSGFARVLSNACFSRQQHPIYPDVFDAAAPASPSAFIDLIDEKGTIATLPFAIDTEHAELKRGFVVFDSAVASRHLTDTGPLGFTPTGFDIFPEMARAYAALQAKLAADIRTRSRPNPLANVFIGPETPASMAATALNASTKVDVLKSLGAFGPDQSARIEQLQSQADQLRAQSPEAEVKRLVTAKPQLLLLKDQLHACREKLSEEMLDADVKLRAALVAAANDFARTSADQFKHEGLSGVGSPAWERMILGSQELSSHQHEHYPTDGDVCLLCQQPLGAEEQRLFARYAAFTSSDSRAALNTVQQNVEARVNSVEQISTSLSAEGAVAHMFLAQSHPSVLAAVSEAAKQIEQLKAAVRGSFAGQADSPAATAIPDFSSVLDEVVRTIESDLQRLQQSDVPATLAALEKERIELRHREVLSQNLEGAVSYVMDLKWIARAESTARGALNPRHLTEKQTDLFATVIARNYRDNLTKECEALSCDVPVEFRTQGRQGQTVRSLSVGDRPPDDVLSEGEQRAVALADFLTEVGLNANNVGIILDDPVTSLDHDRKGLIAARLVAEAKKRQVVVFTHDMVFFSKLGDAADKANTEMQTHWIQRFEDKRPGMVSPNDGPTTTPQYRKPDFAEQTLAKAKAAAGSAQETLIRQAAGQLRRTVEEIVPQYLFKQVVQRWTDRVMVTALKRVNWDNVLADEIVEVFESCSAIMEGHSHTEAGSDGPPTVAELEALISKTKDLIRRARTDRP
jgi:hypothetical protein